VAKTGKRAGIYGVYNEKNFIRPLSLKKRKFPSTISNFSTKGKFPMNHRTVLVMLLLCASHCGSSQERNRSEKSAVDTVQKSHSQQALKRPNTALVKKEPDWSAWKTDTAEGRKFFLIDDSSLVLNDEKKLMERAANFGFYTQGRAWNGKPMKIAVFSRAIPLLKDNQYLYVGNKNQIPPQLKEEWKRRYIADYNCEVDTITFYPGDPSKKKSIFFKWKGHRSKNDGVLTREEEEHPNELFGLDTLP
jgi:hypothetical protein